VVEEEAISSVDIMRLVSMSSLANAASNSGGKIWIYRPQHKTPFPSTLTSLKESSTVVECPLPKTTPTIPLSDRLHSKQPALKEMNQIKSDFYRDQFNQRVSKSDIDRIEKRRIQSPHSLRETDVTVYLPNSKSIEQSKLNGICLHVHGGGWVWGDSQHQVAHRCLEMASHLNAAVVSVEYSLLHHDRFDPVGDTLTALEWVEYAGANELHCKPIFVASGESSGAHLLMLAMLRRRDDRIHKLKLQNMWKCLNLVYGVYDLSGSPSIHSDGDTSSPLCGNDLMWLYDKYCSRVQHEDESVSNRKNPSLSPLYADLSFLPPSLISIGTADPLLDDSLMMAEKYLSHKNDVEIALYEDGEHGIGHFGLQENELMGDQARQYTLNFLLQNLAT